jgi:hypothetical protein
MPAPGRYPNGVNNALKNTTLWSLPVMDPTRVHTYFTDFNEYVAGDWTITETGSGSRALTDVAFGALTVTNASGGSDANYLQKKGESFLLGVGKQAWFKTRLNMSHATTADVVVGLQITDTTPLDATDGIYFLKPAASTSWSLVCRKDATTGSTSASAIATAVASTNMSLGWYYDGKGTVKYYIDDAHTGSITDIGTTYLPDTELTVSFGILGASMVGIFDYLFAAIER